MDTRRGGRRTSFDASPAGAEEIEASINDELARLRQLASKRESRSHCAECEEPIPEARRIAVRGVSLCVPCQQELDAQAKPSTGINRRGSKDSQLK